MLSGIGVKTQRMKRDIPGLAHIQSGDFYFREVWPMKPFRLCYFSATATEISSLSEAIKLFNSKGGNLKVYARTQIQLMDTAQKEAFVKQAMNSEAVIITLHGGKPSFPAHEIFSRAIQDARARGEKIPYIHIQPTGGEDIDEMEFSKEFSTDFGTPLWDDIRKYLLFGGVYNIKELFLYLHNRLFGTNFPCEPPKRLPTEGIYHPDFPSGISLEDYLVRKFDPSRITAGLWFYQTYWLNNDLSFVDAIIRSLEKHGANVIPVFHMRYKDALKNNQGADETAKTFFMDSEGHSRIDVLINPLMFSLGMGGKHYQEILPGLGVPVLQVIMTTNPYKSWKESVQGISVMDVAYSVAQPEFDGCIITVPVACREQKEVDPLTGALVAKYFPIPERIDKAVRLAINWGRLRKIPKSERRVAIVFHHYPPRNDRIGCAAGLDSFSSVKVLLDRLKKEGYFVERAFESGDELANELLSRVTADRNWLPPEEMALRAEAFAVKDNYLRWHGELPEKVREKIVSDWGTPPGDLFVHEGKMFFAGMINGNVFITIQPPRGYLENIDKIYHDLYLSPPHHYLFHYRWIRDVFKAHVVVHVGKHGSLEWLPGKAVGLSEECYPDLAIMEFPNVYPYIINDPGEGTQAKRRSYACIIDHLTPVYTNADLYEGLARVESLMSEYRIAETEDPAKIEVLRPMIWEAVEEANLQKDLGISKEEAMENFDSFFERLHEYLHELGDTMINDGLHVMGIPPEGDRLVEFLVQLTRLPNGDVPSLREAVVRFMGFDFDDVIENKGKKLSRFSGRTGAEILKRAHELSLNLVKELSKKNYARGEIPNVCLGVLGGRSKEIEEVLDYISTFLVPSILRCKEEVENTLLAFDGSFVSPGPSGAPTRGQADILPTGRNFYSVDPKKIPTPSAWEVGVKLGNALLKRYLDETGKYPESVGILVYGTSTMRTRGDDIAEILYLMGVKPKWQRGSGDVVGLEVIPLEELKRPRIDVSARVSGFFRDAFPNLIELIDSAVRIVSLLDEPLELNKVRKHVLNDMEDYRKGGFNEEEAFREATLRIFGCPPGTYGAGVSELIESKNWKTQEDLANNYIRYSSHAYGKGIYGDQKIGVFRRILSRMDVTVKNEDSREYDMMSCTDYYNYYGGLIVSAKVVRGEMPFSVMGDSSDPRRVKVRTTFEEAKHVLRSRLVNPKWLEGMKRHGYKGAGDISHVVDIVFGWDATAEVMEDWMYEEIAKAYALDPEMREWLKKVNPFALYNILDKLLEAIGRGMWKAKDETEEKLRELYLEMEGEIEEWTDFRK